MPRKIVSALVAIVFTVCAFSVFTGCYNSSPAPMEKLVGTYKLTKYEYRLEKLSEVGSLQCRILYEVRHFFNAVVISGV